MARKSRESVLNERYWQSQAQSSLVQKYKKYLSDTDKEKSFLAAEIFVDTKMSDVEFKPCGFKTRREVIIFLAGEQPPPMWD